jgi:hypothetical protein
VQHTIEKQKRKRAGSGGELSRFVSIASIEMKAGDNPEIIIPIVWVLRLLRLAIETLTSNLDLGGSSYVPRGPFSSSPDRAA